jgi:peptidoglycan/LPS O-acetylase OafA/YrhL
MSTIVLTSGKKDSPAGSPLPSGRIPELDGLRGFAILLVIICHYIANADHAQLGFWPHRILSTLAIGWSGVDLFFVLSGFLIGGILLDARTAPSYFRDFYVRRVHRILPIYYLWTLVYGALIAFALWLIPGRYAVTSGDFFQIPLHLLFLQNMAYSLSPFQWKWFSVTWSLAVEEQFYLVAPPLIRFLSLRRIVLVLAATVCLAPVLRFFVFRYLNEGNYVAVFAMPCRADALASGMLLAIAWRTDSFRKFVNEHHMLLQRVLLALFLSGGGLLWWLVRPINAVTITIGYTCLAAFYACLLVVALSQPQGWIAAVSRWSVLRALGTISYCVYVIHFTFNQLAHQLLLHGPPQINNAKGIGVSLLALALTLAVARLSWRYFEKPLIQKGHAYTYGDERIPLQVRHPDA